MTTDRAGPKGERDQRACAMLDIPCINCGKGPVPVRLSHNLVRCVDCILRYEADAKPPGDRQ